MLRPRLFETENFERYWDRYSSRPRNLKGVESETETGRDWAKVVETETLSRVSLITDLGHSGISMGIRDDTKS